MVKLVFILSDTDTENPSMASDTSDYDRSLGQRIFRLGSAGQGSPRNRRKNILKFASDKMQTLKATLPGFGGGGGGSDNGVPQRTSSAVREGKGGEGKGRREGGRGKEVERAAKGCIRGLGIESSMSVLYGRESFELAFQSAPLLQ